jgi:C1A family cysteine protease
MSVDLSVLAQRTLTRGGWRPDSPDHRDRIFNNEEVVLRDESLPLKFGIAKLPAIFNQLELGSCTANAIVRALMTLGLSQGEAEVMLSRLFVYFNERVMEGTVKEDAGAEIRDGIKSVATLGAPPESECPYDIAKFKSKPSAKAYADAKKHLAIKYQRVLPGGAGSPIRTPIYHGFPVVFGFSVPAKFEDGSWDPTKEYLPLPGSDEGFIGGHAVAATGWDFSLKRFKVPVFQIDNSWGEDWGIDGRFWIDARYLNQPALNLSSDFWVVSAVS